MNTTELRAYLSERYPNAFKPKNAQKVPLKVGIRNDILAAHPELSKDEVNAALSDYTGGPKYLTHLQPGADRFDLGGAISGKVTDGEAALGQETAPSTRGEVAPREGRQAHEFKAEGEP
jgi:ProP effector